MAAPKIRPLLYAMLGAFGVGLSFIALIMLSQAAENSENFDQLANSILWVNVLCLFVLLLLLVGNLSKLYRDYRQHVPGSKLKARMVGMFVGLAIIPLLIVFYFSMQFINRGIDTWFNVEVEAGLDDALTLSRNALAMQMRDHVAATEQVAERLRTTNSSQFIYEIGSLRQEIGANELTLFGKNGRIIATNSDQTAGSAPKRVSEELLMQVRQNRPYVSLDPLSDGSYEIKTGVPLVGSRSPEIIGLIRSRFTVSQRIGRMVNSIDSSYTDYKKIVYLRAPLKRTFSLTLTVVLMISLLASIYGAFVLSRRLVSPIQNLVEGTQAVAKGDFDTQLPIPTGDEIGFLVNSFNEMTRGLSSARQQASLSQNLVEAERANLEIILANLSTGVISLEADLRIRTVNKAAGAILDVDLKDYSGELLSDVAANNTVVQELYDVVKRQLDKGITVWHDQIIVHAIKGRRVLTCACTDLSSEAEENVGYVVVFDDITLQLQSQRDAAWGEVARRLAHEIKNPLTPIQLSAERLRQKYLKTMTSKDGEILDRSTHIIVEQVAAMRDMVNAFSDYARAPDMEISSFDIKILIDEVIDLYKEQEARIKILFSVNSIIEDFDADPGRIRQMMHNLIRNSIEAIDVRESGFIKINVNLLKIKQTEMIEILVEDNGGGFEAESLGQIFDPYVTSKPKGTGLGLAIVKKLVEEHMGSITAVNTKNNGALIRILLPKNERYREILLSEIKSKQDIGRAIG
ncbi:MAG: two-component sensor histidine kinase [Woeseiaceae bacterium]|nr:two-component sensor histidine kinase [Woeseiaceae bacterium]|tara:strand:+ start:643 stop:2874 length:2232 start_codon:yes stop_codon:yes gene_type:complete